jgi:tetratricopeptide (TPR) repeat protein
MILTLLPLLLATAAPQAATPAGPPAQTDRYTHCMDLAANNPAAGIEEGSGWRLAGGGVLARQCLGVAYANANQLEAAAAEFEAAARAAELAKDNRSAAYWAQAGNAWLAAKSPLKSRAALDAALAAGTLSGIELGEAYLDHARAQVASGELDGARGDIDQALTTAAADPLAWLLSATLARRMDDLPRAKKDIAEALRRSGDDASVQLEAGNIAALSGDEAGAKEAWKRAVAIAPDAPAGRSAQAALAQFLPKPTP